MFVFWVRLLGRASVAEKAGQTGCRLFGQPARKSEAALRQRRQTFVGLWYSQGSLTDENWLRHQWLAGDVKRKHEHGQRQFTRT
jgi:hypothetical protein